MAFFQTRKPRKFEYKPRFYDPDKEELENLKAKYGEIEGKSYKRRIDFRQAMKDQKDIKLRKPVPASKIIIYTSIAIAAVYLLLTYIEKW